MKSLATGGSTALGPALSLCVGIASNFPASEVILCTDGVSNVGVGNLESGSAAGQEFYTSVSTACMCVCTLPVYVIHYSFSKQTDG